MEDCIHIRATIPFASNRDEWLGSLVRQILFARGSVSLSQVPYDLSELAEPRHDWSEMPKRMAEVVTARPDPRAGCASASPLTGEQLEALKELALTVRTYEGGPTNLLRAALGKYDQAFHTEWEEPF